MKKVWDCKVGFAENVPAGGDLPMRETVRKAFFLATGVYPDFIFSGWDGQLTGVERELVERRK